VTRAALLLALPLVLLLAGCPDDKAPPTIEVYAVTNAPPARTATVVTDTVAGDHHITITRGVALALGCWDSCTGACDAPSMTVGDPTLASVRRASRPNTYSGTTWVLAAIAAGETQLTVTSTCTTQSYLLHVREPGQ
jgi:hypothetical protein